MHILISEHQNILNSPAIVPILVEQNKNIYDSGHSEYFTYGTERIPIFESKFPSNTQMTTRNNQFLQNISNSAIEKKFDLIILTKGYSPFISEEIIKNYYEYQRTITVGMPYTFQKFELDIWKPK